MSKLNEIIEYIERKLDVLESEEEEINEWKGNDFNPMDASGGNFDDAYYLGTEHGEVDGKLSILYGIKSIIEKEEK